MTARFIFSDIDGCLSSEASVPLEFDEDFQRFVRMCRDAARGIGSMPPMTVCTGRPQPYVEATMKLLDIRLPGICENGAVIYTLYDNRSRYGPGITSDCIAGLQKLRVFIERELLPSVPGAYIQFGKEAQLSVFSAEPSLLLPLLPPIESYLSRNPDIDVDIKPSHYYLNISPSGVTKGRAIEHVMKELGATRDEVVGIGDTVGDLPIREAVSFFACPANSHEEIKAVADYISPFPLLRGVLDILAHPRFQK